MFRKYRSQWYWKNKYTFYHCLAYTLEAACYSLELKPLSLNSLEYFPFIRGDAVKPRVQPEAHGFSGPSPCSSAGAQGGNLAGTSCWCRAHCSGEASAYYSGHGTNQSPSLSEDGAVGELCLGSLQLPAPLEKHTFSKHYSFAPPGSQLWQGDSIRSHQLKIQLTAL